ncbi:hypothetical protein PENTCL1PPCAC_30510 [Pristionchus entomophagus]|uniref:Uncharacterized protein n=1 Tax=Pristionchus entomophagus TaxID=358040 RepID=A0AAV5UJC5_9BILA|nr:hypothetical protein PENTCL1PPCAC_28587 [Pristionchus entomophagus]GMT08336.1 hypothetical protein PENTCL1PPCAC_30510 [Pristionchus entomophagus]
MLLMLLLFVSVDADKGLIDDKLINSTQTVYNLVKTTSLDGIVAPQNDTSVSTTIENMKEARTKLVNDIPDLDILFVMGVIPHKFSKYENYFLALKNLLTMAKTCDGCNPYQVLWNNANDSVSSDYDNFDTALKIYTNRSTDDSSLRTTTKPAPAQTTSLAPVTSPGPNQETHANCCILCQFAPACPNYYQGRCGGCGCSCNRSCRTQKKCCNCKDKCCNKSGTHEEDKSTNPGEILVSKTVAPKSSSSSPMIAFVSAITLLISLLY